MLRSSLGCPLLRRRGPAGAERSLCSVVQGGGALCAGCIRTTLLLLPHSPMSVFQPATAPGKVFSKIPLCKRQPRYVETKRQKETLVIRGQLLAFSTERLRHLIDTADIHEAFKMYRVATTVRSAPSEQNACRMEHLDCVWQPILLRLHEELRSD